MHPLPASLPGLPTRPLTFTPITCRHDGAQVSWCGVDRAAGGAARANAQPPVPPTTWAPHTWAAQAPQEVWRARADHGRIACSCQPFHFWAVAHLGMTLPQPCPSETGQDRPCLRPRMGLFSIHRRLPAFQPSLLASSVMVTRAYTGTGMAAVSQSYLPPRPCARKLARTRRRTRCH